MLPSRLKVPNGRITLRHAERIMNIVLTYQPTSPTTMNHQPATSIRAFTPDHRLTQNSSEPTPVVNRNTDRQTLRSRARGRQTSRTA